MLKKIKDLSKIIFRKFEEVLDASSWQISSDQGWTDIKTINFNNAAIEVKQYLPVQEKIALIEEKQYIADELNLLSTDEDDIDLDFDDVFDIEYHPKILTDSEIQKLNTIIEKSKEASKTPKQSSFDFNDLTSQNNDDFFKHLSEFLKEFFFVLHRK